MSNKAWFWGVIKDVGTTVISFCLGTLAYASYIFYKMAFLSVDFWVMVLASLGILVMVYMLGHHRGLETKWKEHKIEWLSKVGILKKLAQKKGLKEFRVCWIPIEEMDVIDTIPNQKGQTPFCYPSLKDALKEQQRISNELPKYYVWIEAWLGDLIQNKHEFIGQGDR
jgi:hypothetical protein